MDLKPGYKESIEVYRQAYIKLEAPASPKVHILTNHVVQFLDGVAKEFPGKGLGFFSEQV